MLIGAKMNCYITSHNHNQQVVGGHKIVELFIYPIYRTL